MTLVDRRKKTTRERSTGVEGSPPFVASCRNLVTRKRLLGSTLQLKQSYHHEYYHTGATPSRLFICRPMLSVVKTVCIIKFVISSDQS